MTRMLKFDTFLFCCSLAFLTLVDFARGIPNIVLNKLRIEKLFVFKTIFYLATDSTKTLAKTIFLSILKHIIETKQNINLVLNIAIAT